MFLTSTMQAVLRSLRKKGRMHRSRMHGRTANALIERGLIEMKHNVVTLTELGKTIRIQYLVKDE